MSQSQVELSNRTHSPDLGAHTPSTLTVELEFLYIKFEGEFINSRIVLIILANISAALAVLAYLFRNGREFAPIFIPIMMGLGWGFYRVIAGIIVAKGKMRKIRKTQELLKSAIENA